MLQCYADPVFSYMFDKVVLETEMLNPVYDFNFSSAKSKGPLVNLRQ